MPSKQRFYTGYYRWGPTGQYRSRQLPLETITYSNNKRVNGHYVGFSACDHKKLKSSGGVRIDHNANLYEKDWSYWNVVPWDAVLKYGRSKAYLSLDFQENNGFELIPFLMDWDETLAMFSKKFIKEITYGSVNWGILPFISDLKSLCGTLSDIRGGIATSYEKYVGKRFSRRFSWETTLEDTYFTYSVSGTTAIGGVLDGDIVFPDDPARSLAIFLDEIGLNPDLKTAWDVIPMSFVVDYFLPIGDFLESLHPRGWFNPTFKLLGGWSVEADIDQKPRDYYGAKTTGDPASYSLYVRQPGYLALNSRPTVMPEFKSPSYRELFNTAYLKISSMPLPYRKKRITLRS